MLELDPIAAHEAAHAVVAHFFGGAVTLVSCARTKECSGKTCADMSDTTRMAKLLVTLAGRAAHIKVDPSARTFGRDHRHWAEDMRHAHKHVDGLFYDQHGRFPSILDEDECKRISQSAEAAIVRALDDPAIWSAVCAVTAALAAASGLTLAGEQFRVIVSSHLDEANEGLKALGK